MATDKFYNQEEDFTGWPGGQDESYTYIEGEEDRESFFERHELDIPTFILIGAFIGFCIGLLTATLISG